nr:hypothetical protein [Rickettsia endosymbiont of Ceutorhynchus assimilis]
MPYNHKPELIELLINEPISERQVNNPDNYVEVINRARPQGFAEHFALLLEDIPAIHSSIAPEFFSYFFLGTSLTLPNTSLMSKLNIEDVFFKFDKNALKLIFKIRNQDYYKLKFIIINTDAKSQNVKFTEKELSEAKRQLSDSTGNIISTEIEGQILHIVNDKGFKIKILPELSH